MKSAEDVIREIEEAFAGVPLGQRTLHEAELMDGYASEPELKAARGRDRERDWRHVPDVSIQECGDALSFLDPVSWRFYLPAYMRHALRGRSHTDSVIYGLDPAGIRQRERHTEDRFGTLDAAQVRAVCSFLLFASQNGDFFDDAFAQEALDDYWAERAAANRVDG